MSLIVDASIAVKWYVEEPGSAAARRLLEPEDILAAPAHIEAEVGQVLRRRIQAGEIGLEQALAAAASLSESLALVPLSGLMAPAIRIACDAGVSTYDALYVAAAITWKAPLATDDRRLKSAVERTSWASEMTFVLLEGAT